jgi:hypothetical protein
MTSYGPPEHVHVENEWYDGPRAGIADVNGLPHRFVSQFDEEGDEYLGTFLIWPIQAEELSLEQEQWKIFVGWNALYEAGAANTDSHPGHAGVNKRWDELASLLESRRKTVPQNARRARAHMVPLEREGRYESTGPAYRLSWALL